ncbi:MAG: hypothetical protein HY865_06555 [Chloroflexi bacterium]|nr:hypothetical protein [Chloroflexota bacterium]
MKTFLNRFILSIPRLYIKQFPYAWIVFIALWTYPPQAIIFIFPFIILLGLFMLQWRHAVWLSTLREEHAPRGGKFYVDRPPVSMQRAVKNIPILLAAAGTASFFLNRQVGLEPWQMFSIIVGFSLLYRDSTFFGAPTTYVITASGIAVHFAPGHLDYRLFLKFNEINRIERRGYENDKGWDCFARVRANDGLLLIPKNPNGFTKRIERLFIVPKDIEKFQEQLSPYGFL